MTRVLVAEDDPQLVRALKINFQARKFDVVEACDGGPAAGRPPAGRSRLPPRGPTRPPS